MKIPTVEIVPYNTQWPKIFEQESRQIHQLLGNHLSEIYHIGSTSIPDMPAKPVIDILIVCEDLDFIDVIAGKLNCLNYFNIRRQIIPHSSYFVKKLDEKISFNLHIYERGSPQINRHVNFRDYVINHPDVAHAYAALKIKLAKKFKDDMNAYVLGKDKLVQEIDTSAKRWSFRKNDYLAPNTGHSVKTWTQEKTIKAMVANLNVYMTHFAQYLNQVELIRMPGFTVVNSGLPDNSLNYVLDGDFSSAEADKKILEITEYFSQKQIPFSWWVSPYDNPEDLAKILVNNGYVNTDNHTAMYFDLDAWDENISTSLSLEIIQAKDERTLRDFAQVVDSDNTSFEKYFEWIASILTDDDPIEYYVGYLNGNPVVRGSACYFAQVAGIHLLSTKPSERRKGYDKVMQEYLLKRAKDLGYHIAFLQASRETDPLDKEMGFKECCVFRKFQFIKK